MNEIIETIRIGVLTAGLCLLSICDIRTHTLRESHLLLLAAVGAGLSLWGGIWTFPASLLAFAPGALLLVLALATRESIGLGDAFLVLALGCFYTAAKLWSLCLAAVTLAGAVALVLLVFFQKGKKTRLPFVPFVFAAHLILGIICGREGWLG